MTKPIQFLLAFMMIIFFSSFTIEDKMAFVGTYGVCDSDPSQIKLTINSDHSFYYQDFSNPNKKININGNWIMKGKKVHLESNSSDSKYHNVWTFDANGQVAKSRKGIAFYRLVKING